MVNRAVPCAEGLASLVARTLTTFGLGGTSGARNSTGPANGPLGAWHGELAGRQMSPPAMLPFVEPFTSQVTFWSAMPSTVAVTICTCCGGRVRLGGATLTVTCAAMVTVAAAKRDGSAALTASTVTCCGAGTS